MFAKSDVEFYKCLMDDVDYYAVCANIYILAMQVLSTVCEGVFATNSQENIHNNCF